MRGSILCGLLAVITACGSSTDAGPVRYNFAVIDGRNQISTAGDATLGKRVTTQLTRDPQGQFATRALDFLLPTKAYAQGLTLAGEPLADQIVCAREAGPGEPEAIPLCAFTLADGKAPIEIKGGTKSGTFVVTFTAQVQSQEPVMDSTTVIVEPGPMVTNSFSGTTFFTFTSPATFAPDLLKDQYGNAVSYTFVVNGPAHVAGLSGSDARTLIADKDGVGTVDVMAEGRIVASGKLTAGSDSSRAWITLEF